MAEFMLMIRDEGVDFSKMPKAQAEGIIGLYMEWSKKLRKDGRHKVGEKLKDEGGKSLKVKNGKIVVDGPYADSKEVIGGFYIVKAESYDEAVEVAKGCPALSYGGSIEIREVDGM